MLRMVLNLSIAAKVVGLLVITLVLFSSVILLWFLPMVEREIISDRKKGLKYIVEVTYFLLSEYEQRSGLGEFSREHAQERAMTRIRQMRYGDNEYLWINDDTLPFPKMIMHPTKPELDGRILDDSRFECTTSMEFGGNGRVQDFPGRDKNLFQAFVEVVAQTGDGFVVYDWPRPTRDGVTQELYSKQSYVRLFQPWGWVIGTGVYVDDIAAQTARMRMTVISVTSMILAAVMFVAVLFIASIQRPMKALIGYAERVTQGELDVEASGRFYGETDQLKQTITTMVGKLKQTIRDTEVKSREVEHAAVELHKSNKRYDQLVRQSRTMTWEVDADGLYTHVGDVAVELIGYRPQELVGKMHLYDLHPQEGREAFKAAIMELFQQREPVVDLDNALVHKDGHTAWVSTNGYPELNSDGALSGYRGSDIDITDRKQAEDELRQANLVVENSPAILFRWKVAENWPVIMVSRNISQFGYSQNDLLSGAIRYSDMVCPDDLERMNNEIKYYTSNNIDRYHQEYRLLTSGGEVRWVDDLTTVIRGDDGQVVEYQGIVLDITERKQAEMEKEKIEEQLRQAQKMESVGRLAGGVAHDFNNMLGIILGHADMALEYLDPGQPVHSDLTEIRKATMRSADLVRQLLAFARKQTIAPKVLDLNDTVEGMLKMLRRLIGENIDLSWVPGKNLWPVNIDPSQIDQILANLCVNARDAIDGVGKVMIETDNVTLDEDYCAHHAGSVPGDYVLLAVSDDGSGIEKEILDKIYDPFFTTKEVGKGTGLGLPTAYGIVKQNNGYINVYSEPGEGTTFRIYIPRHIGEAKKEQRQASDETIRGGDETILLVEDEPMLLQMGTAMLEKLGYRVLAAGSPSEALRIAAEHKEDIRLLITDVIMPGMNGREMADRLSEICPGMKLLFMSGYTADVITHHGVLDFGVKFIQKPFSMKDLANRIREALES